MKHIGSIIEEHFGAELVKFNRHRWKDDECVQCGCLRFGHIGKFGWTDFEYVDPGTGEVGEYISCRSKQLKLF